MQTTYRFLDKYSKQIHINKYGRFIVKLTFLRSTIVFINILSEVRAYLMMVI